MDPRALDDLADLLPPLLTALERLNLLARHFDPPRFAELMAAIGEPEADLRAALPRLQTWPGDMVEIGQAVGAAGEAVIAAFEGLRGAAEAEDGLMAVFRALRHGPIARGRWSLRCAAAAAMAAASCGAGCAAPAPTAPSWSPRPPSAAPGR